MSFSGRQDVQTIIVRSGNPGIIAGLLGCVLAVLGIFFIGIVFVPLAAICSVVGVVRGMIGGSAAGIGASVLGCALTVMGFFCSPSLMLIASVGILSSVWPHLSPPAPKSIAYPQPAPAPIVAPSRPAPVAPLTMQEAAATEASAVADCRARRLAGELRSYIASAHCANPRIIIAYQRANYRYMDLIVAMTAKREQVSERIDAGQITEAQANLELTQFRSAIIDKERQRDAGR
jgi:hypothetical protein